MADRFTVPGLKAAADLSNFQYHIVRLSAAGQVNVGSHDGDEALLGVLQNKPESGEHATVQYAGYSKVYAGAAISAGVPITCNGSGRAVAATSGDVVVGKALEAAGAAGDIIDALLTLPVKWGGSI